MAFDADRGPLGLLSPEGWHNDCRGSPSHGLLATRTEKGLKGRHNNDVECLETHHPTHALSSIHSVQRLGSGQGGSRNVTREPSPSRSKDPSHRPLATTPAVLMRRRVAR
jgi:hypothetical protein